MPHRRRSGPPRHRAEASGPTRRAVLAGATGALVAAPALVAAGAGSASAATTARTALTMQNARSGLPFMFGASGDGVADGRYARAMGRSLDIAATWADDTWSTVNLPQLQAGGDLAGWDAALDVAVGAIDSGAGESWAAAATGAYDARWRAGLTALAAARAAKAGTTFVRFAHEFNGNWYPWSVTAAEGAAFRAAWARYRALQLAVFPAARLVFCANQNTSGYDGDWRVLYPGAGQVDVMGVDFYNAYPYSPTAAAFTSNLARLDGHGAPAGLGAHAAFAASVGLPIGLGEWSAVSGATGGDAPEFVTAMRAWLGAHAGTGAGQVLYANQYNVANDDGKFSLVLSTKLPASAAAYRAAFGG